MVSQHLRPLQILMLVALLNGTLYFLLIPPWWHYDEPGQFEYLWLVANRPGWPKVGEYDEAMRTEMARSMQHYGWYALRDTAPDFSGNKPIWIGATQTGGMPLYYFVASLPLRLLRGADITFQYYAARLVSLLFYLLTILIVWKAMGELVPEGHPLQWLVTGFIALLPAFTDVMVGLGDDVGAILVSCLFLWLSIRLVKRGLSASELIPWVASLILCYLTKNTAWYALLLAPFVLLLSLLRGRLMWLPWAATPILLLIGALAVLEGGGAASWYQDRTQIPSFRMESPSAPLGKYIFQLDLSGERRPPQTGQFLSRELVTRLRGKTVTLGAWIWSDRIVTARPPFIRFVTDQLSFVDTAYPPMWIRPTPSFFQSVLVVPSNANYGILIPPYIVLAGRRIPLFFDGMVLAEGDYPTGAPQFGNAAGSEGNWNGRPFQNLVENGSAEQGAPRVRPAVDERAAAGLSSVGTLSGMFSLMADWQGTSWYYRNSFQTMFRTFWTSVAADKFNLPGNVYTYILLVLAGAGILGTAHLLWRRRKTIRWDLVYVLLAAGILAWSITTVRGIPTMLTPRPSFPFARYTFPAILPTALLICAGWGEWLRLVGQKYRLSRKALYVFPIGMMGLLSLYVLFNAEKYFHHSLASREPFFWLAGILLVALALLWKRSQVVASLKQV